jgi:hypothetical protein
MLAHSSMPVELQAVLSGLSPGSRRVLGMELEEMSLLSKRPVLLASPVLFVVR